MSYLCLFVPSSNFFPFTPYRHGHHRYINILLRVTKRGTKTTDVKTLRLYSCFANVSEAECDAIGHSNVLRCTSHRLNIPLLFQGILHLAINHPAVGMDTVALFDKPLFFALSVRSSTGVISFPRPMSANEVNSRFAADLAAIGEQRVGGERPCRLYGFRRGGAQDLLNRTGKFELVMRIGDWKANSDSFLVYLTNMNSRATLRSTLRTYKQDEIVQVVSQITHAHTKWVIEQVKKLVRWCAGKETVKSHSELVAFEKEAVSALSRILCEVILELRNGTAGKGGGVAGPSGAEPGGTKDGVDSDSDSDAVAES